MSRKIGMWLYSNGGGDKIQEKIVKKLQERGIKTITDVNLRHAIAKNGHILHNDKKIDKLDLFFLQCRRTDTVPNISLSGTQPCHTNDQYL